MNNNNLRSCVVKRFGGDTKKAYFHRWAIQTRYIVKAQEPPKDTAPYFSSLDEFTPVSLTIGIVEYEDGTVATVEPQQITFTEHLTSCEVRYED